VNLQTASLAAASGSPGPTRPGISADQGIRRGTPAVTL